MQGRLKISCAVAAILSGWGGAAAAADSGTPPSGSEPATSGIEQVVVTASRRSENVQHVPSTIQAFTGQTLAELNASTISDILKYTPNVTFGNNGPGQGNIFMRGLSAGFAGDQSSATVGNFPNVAVYLDDQSMQFPARNVDIYMVDMQRIEVLEGPQGTLFGGGAEAGAVRYITNKPQLDVTSGYAEASYGDTSGGAPNSSANATVNIPVIDNKLAVRLTIYDDNHGGYIDNVPSTFTRSNSDLGNYYFNILPTGGLCPNGLPPGKAGFCTLPGAPQANNFAIAQKDFNPVTYTGARLSALYQVNSDWDVLIAETFETLDAEGLSVEYPTGSDFQQLQPLQVTSFTPSYEKDKWANTAWTVDGKIDFVKVVYTGSYMNRNIKQQMDYTNYSRSAGGMYYQCTGGPNGLLGFGFPGGNTPVCYSPVGYWQDTVRNTHLSNELRFSTPDDWRFRAIAGAYYEQFRIYDIMNFNYKTIPACTPANLALALTSGPPCLADVRTAPDSTANDPGIRSDSTAFGEDTQRGYDQTAFFGSFDYDIIPDVLTVSGGTRWFQYQEFEVGSQYGTNGSCVDVPNGDCGSGMVNIDSHHDQQVYTGHKSRGNITWHITPDTMVYYTFSEGFRPGGFNRNSGLVAPLGPNKTDPQYNKPNAYAPDGLTNQEIGLKSTFLDDRVQLNLSAYAMRWNDIQMLFFNPTELGNTTFGVNGPNYLVKGGEAQVTAEVIDGLTVQGSISVNHDTQSSSPCLVDNVPGSVNLGKCITQIYVNGQGLVPFQNPFGALGTVPAFSPEIMGNLRARYEWTVGNYNAFAQVGGSYMDSMYNQPATYTSGGGVQIPNTTYLRYKQSPYTTFDASFGLSNDKWSAEVFGSNLTDSHASTFTSSAQFIKSEVPLRPRVFGLKVGYKFW
jgi:outer membrane receptor protein involved in Fe transport